MLLPRKVFYYMFPAVFSHFLDNPEVLNNLGVFYARSSMFSINKKNYVQQKKNKYRSRNFILKAIERDPGYAIAFFNLGQIYLLIGERDLARKKFFKAIDILESGYKSGISMSGLCLPLNFDSFHMQWQWTLLEYGQKSDKARRHLSDLLLHRAYEKLGDIYSKRKRKTQPLEYYKKSIHYWPNSAVAEYKLGGTLQKMGHLEKAIYHYKSSMDNAPFYFPAWYSYVKGLYDLNRRKECELACKEFITILNAFPSYRNKKKPFIKILDLLKNKQKLF